MANILINGLNSKTGGGKSILNNYLNLLRNSNSPHRFFVLTPDKREYEKYSREFIRIIEAPRAFRSNFLFPLLYLVALPRLMRTHKIDIIFNLGDIPIPSDIPQVYLFDWAYAVYPNSVVWKRMDVKSRFARKVKLFVFKRWIGYATTVIAQTKTMKEKLKSIYGLNNIEIVPNAVSLENISGGESFNFNFPVDKIKLLYLTYYYSHKNIEIFISLAKEIKKRKLNFVIITTISESQHVKAKLFLDDIKRFELEDVICNIGPVDMKYVPTLYEQSDGLLMPTLLESFSGTYVEAMFHEKPIITSDLDFAQDVCGDAAFYFDPFNADSILSSITQAFDNNEIKMLKMEEGRKILSQLLSWEQVFKRHQELLEKDKNI